MDRTICKKTSIHESDEAFCLALSTEERLAVLMELNRVGMAALGITDEPMVRTAMRKIPFREFSAETIVAPSW